MDLGCHSWTASTPCPKCLEPLGRPGSEIRGFIVKGCRAPPCKVEVVVARRPETPTDAEACEVRDRDVDTRQKPRRRNARPSTCARTCDRGVTRGLAMVREDADGTSTRPAKMAVDGAHSRNKTGMRPTRRSPRSAKHERRSASRPWVCCLGRSFFLAGAYQLHHSQQLVRTASSPVRNDMPGMDVAVSDAGRCVLSRTKRTPARAP